MPKLQVCLFCDLFSRNPAGFLLRIRGSAEPVDSEEVSQKIESRFRVHSTVSFPGLDSAPPLCEEDRKTLSSAISLLRAARTDSLIICCPDGIRLGPSLAFLAIPIFYGPESAPLAFERLLRLCPAARPSVELVRAAEEINPRLFAGFSAALSHF